MPNIQEFSNKVDELHPDSAGIEANVQAGRRIGSFYDQEGAAIGGALKGAGQEIEQHVTTAQVTHGASTYAGIVAGLDDQWNQLQKDPNFDPNDPTVRSKFMQNVVAPALQQWQSGFSTRSGQQWAVERLGAAAEHFNTKTIADMSSQAGIAAQSNTIDAMRNLGSMAYKDPTSAGFAHDTLDASITAAYSGRNIDAVRGAEEMAKAKETGHAQIELGRWLGMAHSDPSHVITEDQIAQDKNAQQYLTSEQRDAVLSQSTSIHRAWEEDQLHVQAALEKQQKDAFDQKVATLEANSWVSDGHGGIISVPPKDAAQQLQLLAQDPGAKFYPGRLEALGNAWHTASQAAVDGADARTTPEVYQHFASLIGDKDGFTSAQVDQAYADHQLSKPDWAFFRGSAKDIKSRDPREDAGLSYLNQSIEHWKTSITKSNEFGQLDPGGDTEYARFYRDVHVAYERQRQLHPDASPSDVVNGMFDPSNGLGVLHTIPAYQRDNKTGMAAVLASVRGDAPARSVGTAAPEPRKPGESAADYLKRTGG